jgi:hypothetical protein
MAPRPGRPDQSSNRNRRLGLVLVLLLSVAAGGWVYYGPQSRLPARLLAEGARRGLLFEGGSREARLLSSTLRDLRLSLRGIPGITVEIGRIDIEHWPLMAPRLSVEQVDVHLRGDPVVLLEAIAKAWYAPEAKLAYRHLEVTYEHRLLGQIHLSGVTLDRRGDWFGIEAARAQVGDLVWQDVRLFLQPRKAMFALGFGAEPGQGRIQLSCFSSTEGASRWILDLPHGPARPLLRRLGGDLGSDFDATQVAGSVSLDIPDDMAQPVHGRVEMVFDGWPPFAPAKAEPLLGSRFSLLSNLVASADGSHWELPHAELAMPVFSLAGKGSIQLGRDRRLVLEVEGERTCRQLRALLPPSQPLEDVRRFLGSRKPESAISGKNPEHTARLRIRWDTGSRSSLFRPEWQFEPGCGLAPWSEGG